MIINNTTKLVAGGIPPYWCRFDTEISLSREEAGFDDKVVLYIAEVNQTVLIKKLEDRGYQLKHTTKNRRTGNTILYYVRQPIVHEEE